MQKIPENIKVFIFDFDGVMTNNQVLVMQDGSEAVLCNRSDGIGIELLREAGYKLLILSSEKNPIVAARAAKLKLDVIHGVEDKLSIFKDFCSKNNISYHDVCYVGNDINDLPVMNNAGFKIAPADAYPPILKIANIITNAKGGNGVIREIADNIINKL